MEKLTRLFTSQVKNLQKNLQKNLETILEHEDWNPQNKKNILETASDIFLLANLTKDLPPSKEDRLTHLFSRLAPYFSGGLLLFKKNQKGHPQKKETWIPGTAFHENIYFPIEKTFFGKNLELPLIHLGEIRKTSPYVLLSKMQLTDICDSPDSSAFVFKPHDHFLFVLFTELPEPWLRRHIEAVHSAILKSMEEATS